MSHPAWSIGALTVLLGTVTIVDASTASATSTTSTASATSTASTTSTTGSGATATRPVTPYVLPSIRNSRGRPLARTASLAHLATLRVIAARPNRAGYSRALFLPRGAWPKIGGCNVRMRVLRVQLTRLTRKNSCTVTGGTLDSPYTYKRTTYGAAQRITKVHVDHIIPLAYYWDVMPRATKAQRYAFAVDEKAELYAAESSVNASKGDRMPSQWSPASRAGSCLLAKAQIEVLRKYAMPVTRDDKAALTITLTEACRT